MSGFPTPHSTTPGTVLLAEDSPVVRLMVRTALQVEGYRVLETEDGELALATAREYEPDVVLLDIMMPGMNGYEVLSHLKADPILRDVPVVFITAQTEHDDVARGLAMGAHDYLRKPFDPTELVARVHAAMRVKHLQDELRARNAVLELMARTDPLTSIANRRYLTDQVRQSAALADRQGTPLAILMIDIDHFKQVNDDFGHDTGDSVLRRVSRAVLTSVRAGDVVGRWGGEEFLAILPDTTLTGAMEVAERVRATVDGQGGRDDQAGPHVTVSIGVSSGPGREVQDILRAADAALYEAKGSGRNTVRGRALFTPSGTQLPV